MKKIKPFNKKCSKQLLMLTCALLCSLLMTSPAHAILISQVLYDADGTDDGFEFIELYNPTNEVISLQDYALYLSNSDTWELVWNETCNDCYLFPYSYYSFGENESNTYMMNLDLQNTKGSIKIENDITGEMDILGYGEALLFLGTVAGEAKDGKVLLRANNTGNNALDFITSEKVERENDNEVLEIEILNSKPVIENVSAITFVDNTSLMLFADDDNGYEDLKLIEVNCSGSLSTVSFSENFTISCDSNLSLRVLDSVNESSQWEAIDLSQPIIEIVSMMGCSALPGEMCSSEIEIKAAAQMDIEITLEKLYGPSGKIDTNILRDYTLDKEETKKVPLEFSIPRGILSGGYQGLLEITITP